ncbi:uncharacterized protein LOC110923789 [Helianthus annuus]|uniref:uncharacterized protein LOC110923789 n=1 Tax=Helianthus annuus TaxID=4232 RepID=UPI001652DAD7|nr:uncharacterized protein LOC110923789 [Helianthus annuus]
MIKSERLLFIRLQQSNLRSETYENLKKLGQNGNPDMSNIGTRVLLPSLFTGGSRYMKENYYDAMAIFVYTIEFQKRGLPHAHICLFLNDESKLPSVDHVDNFISAEIPAKNLDPDLYNLVSDYMIHGPCGVAKPNCPCMVEGTCSKKFPKKFSEQTTLDSNGYPVYRRADSGFFVEKSGIQLDNRSVVPYSKTLLRRYQAHINVEWCNQAASIKYLFKYINKGPDRAGFGYVQNADEGQLEDSKDEIKEYYDCRYLSAYDATWRIFAFDVHYRYPSVMRLPSHLPDKQNVVYGPDDDLDSVLHKPSVASTMFLGWMEKNQKDPLARSLTYVEFPTKFVWKLHERVWDKRIIGKSIGRIHCVNPSMGEAYFLRILLNKVKGPKSFEEIRTVNGEVFPTFRDACYARGLLDDDKEYIEAIKEAYYTGSGYYLRNLFATMLASNTLSRPEHVWENTWEYLSDGILYNRQKLLRIEGLSLPEEQIRNLTLLEIKRYLLRNNSSLSRFPSMAQPDTVNSNAGGVFFVYGYGGTGKTFMWKTLSASIRCKGDIVLNVASSESSMCFIKPDDDVADLLRKMKLIIWDEAPMNHKHASEVLDRTMKDIFKCEMTFGRKVMVFGGDFRQILPVVPNGSRREIVNASITSSYIWSSCKVLTLTKNTRLTVGANASDIKEIKAFANWLLELGEGKIGGSNDCEVVIDIPEDLLIKCSEDPMSDLIDFVYPSLLQLYKDKDYFTERAILAPTNEVVQEISERLLASFPGDEVEYLSSDSIYQTDQAKNEAHARLYSPDVLNGLKISGLPNHRLVLKVDIPVMLLRNID